MTSWTPATDAWLTQQQAGLEALTGLTVSAWGGVEMALREESPDGPLFTDPDVRFLQLSWLRLIADAGERTIGIYQDNDWFGLRLEDVGLPTPDDCHGIFRWRTLDLATGHIDAVRVAFDEGTLARVTLTIDGQDLLLVAGEVYETWGGTGSTSTPGSPTRAFYVTATTLGGPAWERAGRIWYETLTGPLARDAGFATFARATLDVARERYGAGAEVDAVAVGWDDVGVVPAP